MCFIENVFNTLTWLPSMHDYFERLVSVPLPEEHMVNSLASSIDHSRCSSYLGASKRQQ